MIFSASPHLAPREHCTGCGACASGCPKAAITMERDREGFAYPVIDGAACVRCGHCTAVCPVLRERPQSSMPAVFAAWNRNDEIRRDSTSGGVFTLLLIKVAVVRTELPVPEETAAKPAGFFAKLRRWLKG